MDLSLGHISCGQMQSASNFGSKATLVADQNTCVNLQLAW